MILLKPEQLFWFCGGNAGIERGEKETRARMCGRMDCSITFWNILTLNTQTLFYLVIM